MCGKSAGKSTVLWRSGLLMVVSTCCAFPLQAAAPVGAGESGEVASRHGGETLAVARGAPAALDTSAPMGKDATKAGYDSYVVARGDTLWRLSRRFGLSVAQLMAMNAMKDASELKAGQRLRVPAGKEEQPAPQKPALASKTAPDAKAPEEPVATVARAEKVPTGPEPKVASVAEKGPKKSAKGRSYPLRWPVDGKLTSRYGKRWGRAHDGVDIGAKPGTPIYAAASGTVLFAAEHGSYGNLVVLKHADGLVSVYAHNQRNLVREGQAVRGGQLIGRVGQSGRATGPHLHFEVRRGTEPQNPLAFLPP